MHIEGLDQLDNKILEIIKNNARLTYKEIGEQVGISRVSVKTRMDALQEKGPEKVQERDEADTAGMSEKKVFKMVCDRYCNWHRHFGYVECSEKSGISYLRTCAGLVFLAACRIRLQQGKIAL